MLEASDKVPDVRRADTSKDKVPDTPEEWMSYEQSRDYRDYRGRGGIINPKDWASALARLEIRKEAKARGETNLTEALNPQEMSRARSRRPQVENMATFAGIDLEADRASDPKVMLYEILREDVRPEGVEHHHSQMSQQRLFAEVLRMLGDVKALEKLIKAYPNISFK